MPIFGRLAKRVRDIQVRSLRAKRRRSLFLETLELRRVLSATPIIIDNQAACPQHCKAGSWANATGLGFANSIDYSAAPFTGNDVAAWIFNGVEPGLYRVAATWHWGASIYGSNVPITILSDSTNIIGTGTLNQQLYPNDFQEAGVSWETIGVFNTTTNQLIVKMNDNSTGHAIADAMRIERITAVSDSLIIDTDMPGFSKAGAWGSAPGVAGAYGGTVSWSALPSDGSEVAEWTFNVVPGSYRLSTSLHTGASIYGSNNPITVLSGSQVVGNLTVDQTAPYSDYYLHSTWWKKLGVFTVNSTLKVRMTDLGDGYLITDAFRIERVADSTPAPLPPSTSIAIVNPSFEAQYVADGAIGQLAITGWGNGLLLNPIAGHFATGTATNGVNVTTGNTSGAYTLSQLLTHSPLPNKEYRLQVDVGDRLDRVMGSWRIELRSNSKTLAWMDEKFLSVANGGFSTADFVYTTSDQPPSGPLEIVLISTGTVPNGTVSFDNVRLSMRGSRFAIPIANDDLQYYTATSTDLSAGSSLLANDYSFEGTVSSASIVDHPTHGIIISFGANGTFVYRPDPGFVGVDSFTYRTHNGVLQSAIARAQISVGTKLLPKLNRDSNVFNATPASAGFGRGYSNIPVASSMDTDGALTKTGGLLLAEDVLPGLSLVYRADELSRPIIEVESQFPLGITVPASIDAQLVFNGVAYTAATFTTTGFAAGNRFRLALQADASSLPTGRYNYQVNLSASNPNWSTSVSGSRVVVNRTASPFGRGWSLDGLDRIHEHADGLVLVAGNGDFLWFPKQGASYGLADGDTTFTKATKNTDGSYALTRKDGLVSSFNQMGLLVSQRDRSSNITTFSYADQNGDSLANELVSITEPYGRVISLWYTNGHVTSLQHYSGRVTQLSYSGSNLTGYTLTDPDGSGSLASPSISFQYTGNQLTSRKNAVLETTTFEYDATHGRLTKAVHPNFDEWDLVAEETVALSSGSATALKKPTDIYGIVTDGEEEIWKFQTDRFGNITKSITPLLNIRTYLRNANGQVYEALEPDPDKAYPGVAPKTRIGYNDSGDASIIVSPDGGTTKAKYSDRYRQPILTVDPVGRTNRNVYDHAGNPVQSIDGAGNVTSRLFDSRGLETQVTTPDPDGAGPQLSQITGYGYDGFGRHVNTLLPDGAITVFGYTVADEISDWLDELGKLTHWTYDALGRNTFTQNRINAIEQTNFDALSRPVQLIDAIGNVTDTTYDSRSRVATIAYPDPDGAGVLPRPTDVLVYDKNGNLLRQQNPASYFVGELRYKYDAENRVTDRSHSEYVFDDPVDGSDESIYETYEYDDIGRLLKVNRVGRDRASTPMTPLELGQAAPHVFYTYDAVGRIASKTHRNLSGFPLYQESYAYNQAGELISRTDGEDNIATNLYDSRGYMVQETTADPDGAGPQFPLVSRYAYDTLGRLTSVDRGFDRVTTIEYNNRNWATKITEPDPDGTGPFAPPVTQMGYDVRGDQTYEISPLGRVTYYNYDDEQRQIVRYDPDPDGTGPLVAPVSISYFNNVNWLVAETNPRGASTYYGYDSLGRPTVVVAPDPDDSGPLTTPVTSFNYNDRGLTGVIDPLNHLTSFTLDKAGRRVVVTDAAGESTNYTYNFYDQAVTIVGPDPDGTGPQSRSTTEYQYDQNGRLSRSIDALQNSTQFTYDIASNLRTITAPGNQTTTFEYDGLNRLIEETQSSQSTPRSYHYDVAGNLVRTIDRNGRLTQYVYDKRDRVIEEKWANSAVVTASVTTLADGAKRDESQVVGWTANSATNLGGTFRLSFTIQTTTAIAWNADAATIRTALEALSGIGVGNVDVTVTATSTFSRSIAINFKNARGGQNLSQVNITTYTLTPNIGSVTPFVQTTVEGTTTSERQQLSLPYNGFNGTTGIWYLGFGSEISGALPATASAGAVQNALNAFVGIDSVTVTGTYPIFEVTFGGTQVTTDVQEVRVDTANLYPTSVVRTIASSYNAEDELVSVSDPSATINFTRDALGRATSIQNILGTAGPTFTFHQVFDAASNRTLLQGVYNTSGEFVNTYTYDKLDRLTVIDQANTYQSKRVAMAYNAMGQRTQMDRYESFGTTPPIATTNYSYDTANRLSRIEHKKGATVFNAYDYIFDRMSRISSVTSVDGAVDYTYDALSQLLSADDPNAPTQASSQSFSYTYDDNGNRSSTGYTVTADDRIDTAPGGGSYVYDSEGNLTQVLVNGVVSQVLTWDHRNRLTKVFLPSGGGSTTIDYEYDAFNRLVKRTQSGNSSYWGYDGGINPPLQAESQTGISHRYLWSDQVDELLADEQNPNATGFNTAWALADHQGTVKDILDFNSANGTTSLVNHRRYDAFGNRKSQSGTVDIVFGYTGKYFDQVTGLQNSWNRWYSPKLGRFISQDPIGFAAGDANMYRYVGNGATNATDPSGLDEGVTSETSEVYTVYTQNEYNADGSIRCQCYSMRPTGVLNDRDVGASGQMRAATSEDKRRQVQWLTNLERIAERHGHTPRWLRSELDYGWAAHQDEYQSFLLNQQIRATLRSIHEAGAAVAGAPSTSTARGSGPLASPARGGLGNAPVPILKIGPGLQNREGISYELKHLNKHLPDTLQSRRLIRTEGSAHVFKDKATLSRVERELLQSGEITRSVQGGPRALWERIGKRFDEPIGHRIDDKGNSIPLYYGELKLNSKTGQYHCVPRTGPAS